MRTIELTEEEHRHLKVVLKSLAGESSRLRAEFLMVSTLPQRFSLLYVRDKLGRAIKHP